MEMEIIGWIVVGLISGWLAKMVVPGREPGGFFATTAIGIVGAIIGGFIWRMMGWTSAGMMGSILVAFLGAVVLLMLYHAVVNNRSRV
jgi:uncharacterized membrane protein YeaQ/YmgE (transglycosylase-associated protein family)